MLDDLFDAAHVEPDEDSDRSARHRAGSHRAETDTGAAVLDRRMVLGVGLLGAGGLAGWVALGIGDDSGGHAVSDLAGGHRTTTPGSPPASSPTTGASTTSASAAGGTAGTGRAGTAPGKRRSARSGSGSGGKSRRQPSSYRPATDRDDSFAQGTTGTQTHRTHRHQPSRGSNPKPSGPVTLASGAAAAAGGDTAATHQHLLNRSTMGVSPDDRAALQRLGIDKWLGLQLAAATLPDPDGNRAWAAFPLAGASATQVRGKVTQYAWDAMFDCGQGNLARQLFSSRQLHEVMVDLFANILNVAMPSDGVWMTGPDYNASVIRAHALGRYEDMLLAAMRHPAMLVYLNNDQSYREHVNENLGREMLELHTIGLDYTENDVVNSARIMSGRTVNYDTGAFTYSPDAHSTGPVQVLGFRSGNAGAAGGLAVGDDYVRYLARHEATAHSIARKIAVRFVSDLPPTGLVDRLAATYLANDTSLTAVLVTLFRSKEFWAATGDKVRRPLEDIVHSARSLAIGVGDVSLRDGVGALYWQLHSAGQAPLAWMPPNGYPDVAGAWNGAGELVSRWNLHRALASGWIGGGVGPKPSAEVVYAPRPGEPVTTWIGRIAPTITGVGASSRQINAVATLLDTTANADATKAVGRGGAGAVVGLLLSSPEMQIR